MNKFERIIVNKISINYFIPKSLRIKMLRFCGMNIASNVRIFSGCYFDTKLITIRKNSSIDKFCQFHDGGYGGIIVIKDNCMIAMNVTFCCISHEIGNKKRRAGKSYVKPITVESGCWIGTNVTILPGVTIGEGCIIAAGAVVNKDCKPNGLYGGVPARHIRNLD